MSNANKPVRAKEEDSPVRIYKSTLARINAQLDKRKYKHINNKKKTIVKKLAINDFLIMCLDAFEMFKDSQVYYVNTLHTDLAEARGEAVLNATRKKTPVTLPVKVCIVGKDEL